MALGPRYRVDYRESDPTREVRVAARWAGTEENGQRSATVTSHEAAPPWERTAAEWRRDLHAHGDRDRWGRALTASDVDERLLPQVAARDASRVPRGVLGRPRVTIYAVVSKGQRDGRPGDRVSLSRPTRSHPSLGRGGRGAVVVGRWTPTR
jgi:hypothetical protein